MTKVEHTGPKIEALSSNTLTKLRNDLQLVDIQSLLRYELPNRLKVADIALSLQSTGRLVNPVVVDLDRRILIDGHHRIEAFRWLGLTHIPAFAVNYLASDVEVRGWSRATNAPASSVRELYDLLGLGTGGAWTILATDHESRTIASQQFKAPRDSAECLDRISQSLLATGHIVTLDVEQNPRTANYVHSRLEPTIGKEEVMDAIERGEVFPHEINRHLIRGRPLNLNIPITATKSKAAFSAYLGQIFQDAEPVSIAEGYREGDRVYEEKVVLFGKEEQ